MRTIFLVVFSLFFFSSLTSAATIYGSIYDLALKNVENAVVEINTNPMQRFVAVNGTYKIEIPIGNYSITAFYQNSNKKLSAEENITIVDDGFYILDLFLFPVEDEELFEDISFDIYDDPEPRSMFWILFLLAFMMSVFLFFIVKINKKMMNKGLEEEIEIMDEHLLKIIKLLKNNNNRMTQRQIRKHFPLSEAKISLLIAELESMGKLKKIKMGRGNIIILQKK